MQCTKQIASPVDALLGLGASLVLLRRAIRYFLFRPAFLELYISEDATL